MAIRHIPPKGIWPGIDFRICGVWFFLFTHTWQCGQRFTGITVKRTRKIGYQTYGDAAPGYDTYKSGGWYWLDNYFTKRGLKHAFVQTRPERVLEERGQK